VDLRFVDCPSLKNLRKSFTHVTLPSAAILFYSRSKCSINNNMYALTSIHKTIFCSGCYSTRSKNIFLKREFLFFHSIFISVFHPYALQRFPIFFRILTIYVQTIYLLTWDPYLVSRNHRTGMLIYSIGFELASLLS
jgi:hypothetical protein